MGRPRSNKTAEQEKQRIRHNVRTYQKRESIKCKIYKIEQDIIKYAGAEQFINTARTEIEKLRAMLLTLCKRKPLVNL